MPTVKYGRGFVMVWGCVIRHSFRLLVVVARTMNMEVNPDILDNNVLPTMWQYSGNGRPYFQQDNEPRHKPNTILCWFEDVDVSRLDRL
ncbi:hypothetical protein GDO78_016381 [Eleutherodactylus coqui]|uniref:Uncharacterized protein n=1 Tax=Eleutherodactylus coqui TaxID=57060 RepID=A0A8J6B538_ELECQ|nr:hypothetical protein GDO78_016381 [Eleutherodactylus coqui]